MNLQMTFFRIRQLAWRVVTQVRADHRTLVLIMVMPVILLTVAGILIRVEPEHIRIGIINQDTGAGEVNLGNRMTGVLQNMDVFDVVLLDADEAMTQLEDGELDAVITLPPDFTSQTLQNHALVLPVQYEGSKPAIAERLNAMFERTATQTLSTLVIPTAVVGEVPSNPTRIEASYVHGGKEFDTLDYMAPALIGVFVFLFVFIMTSISFLRERLDGTLERLRATPIRSAEIIVGYMLGFMVFGILQGLITLLYTVYVLDIHYAGNLLNVFVVEILLVITSVNLGIFLSTFARNEFQVLQFIPLIVVTQVFLGGVFWEVSSMPEWLQPLAYLMPLTHANTALREIMLKGTPLVDVGGSLLALMAIALGVIVLASRTAGQVRV